MNMRNVLSHCGASAAVVLALAASAAAADLPVTPAPAFSWTGVYFGGNVGGAWSRTSVTTVNTPGTPGIFGVPANIDAVSAAGTGSFNNNGTITGGAQAGYNWQPWTGGLFGLEFDINALPRTTTLNNVAATTLGPFPVSTSFETRWFATFRGRIGATFDRSLLYLTGGLALTEQRLSQTVNAPGLITAGNAFGTASSTNFSGGWTVGGGYEYWFWDRWSIKAEYLFAQFGRTTNSTLVTSTGGFRQTLVATTDRLNVNVARIGLNYHLQ